MISELLDIARNAALDAGQVLEYHLAPDDCPNAGQSVPRGITAVAEFRKTWGYALGRRTQAGNDAAWLGIVHDDGAVLVRV